MGCSLYNKSGAYLDSELSAADRSAFEAHLPACSECSQEVARLQRLSNFLSSAPKPEFNPQQLFWKARQNRQGILRFAEMLTAAAAVVILICGIWLLRQDSQSRNTANTINWERVVVTQQFDPPQNEPDDPLVQVLLREQP